MSSQVDSQFMDSDDYMYEEQKINFDDNQNMEDQDTGSQRGSTLKIPLSKFKMLNH